MNTSMTKLLCCILATLIVGAFCTVSAQDASDRRNAMRIAATGAVINGARKKKKRQKGTRQKTTRQKQLLMAPP